jgi:hypothetical protein
MRTSRRIPDVLFALVFVVAALDARAQTLTNPLTADAGKPDVAIFNVENYGAKLDGVTDDWQAITNAVAAAKVAGAAGLPGGIVRMGPGQPVISQPIVLPRTGIMPLNAVQIEARAQG